MGKLWTVHGLSVLLSGVESRDDERDGPSGRSSLSERRSCVPVLY